MGQSDESIMSGNRDRVILPNASIWSYCDLRRWILWTSLVLSGLTCPTQSSKTIVWFNRTLFISVRSCCLFMSEHQLKVNIGSNRCVDLLLKSYPYVVNTTLLRHCPYHPSSVHIRLPHSRLKLTLAQAEHEACRMMHTFRSELDEVTHIVHDHESIAETVPFIQTVYHQTSTRTGTQIVRIQHLSEPDGMHCFAKWSRNDLHCLRIQAVQTPSDISGRTHLNPRPYTIPAQPTELGMWHGCSCCLDERVLQLVVKVDLQLVKLVEIKGYFLVY